MALDVANQCFADTIEHSRPNGRVLTALFFGRLHLELEAASKQLQDGYRVFCTSGIELSTWHYNKLLNKS